MTTSTTTSTSTIEDELLLAEIQHGAQEAIGRGCCVEYVPDLMRYRLVFAGRLGMTRVLAAAVDPPTLQRRVAALIADAGPGIVNYYVRMGGRT